MYDDCFIGPVFPPERAFVYEVNPDPPPVEEEDDPAAVGGPAGVRGAAGVVGVL